MQIFFISCDFYVEKNDQLVAIFQQGYVPQGRIFQFSQIT